MKIQFPCTLPRGFKSFKIKWQESKKNEGLYILITSMYEGKIKHSKHSRRGSAIPLLYLSCHSSAIFISMKGTKKQKAEKTHTKKQQSGLYAGSPPPLPPQKKENQWISLRTNTPFEHLFFSMWGTCCS